MFLFSSSAYFTLLLLRSFVKKMSIFALFTAKNSRFYLTY